MYRVSCRFIALAAVLSVANTAHAQSGRTAWEGFHFGGHLGWIDSGYGANAVTAPGLAGSFGDNDEFAGGFLYGVSTQMGNWVVGTDSVWTFSDGGAGPALTTAGTALSTDLNYISETRLRAGFLLQPNLLAYGAVGFATADVDVGGSAVISDDKNFWGYTVGGGVEAMFNDRWFVRLEYSHSDFDDENVAAIGGGSYKVDMDNDAVRGAVGYRFDWSPLDMLRGGY